MKFRISSWEADKLFNSIQCALNNEWTAAWDECYYEKVLGTGDIIGEVTEINVQALDDTIQAVLKDLQRIKSAIMKFNLTTYLPCNDMTMSDALNAVEMHETWAQHFRQYSRGKAKTRKEGPGSNVVVACANYDPKECRKIAMKHDTLAQALRKDIHELNNLREVEVELNSEISVKAAHELGLFELPDIKL